jgi:hypothetical protein
MALRGAGELLVADPRLGIPVPAYGGRSLANLAAGLARTLARADAEPPLLPELTGGLDPLEGRSAEGPVVVLLIDGLGWSALHGSAARKPGGAAAHWARRARPLTSTFPTTTTVALTSLSTGASPGQHGVVGHRVYLPRFDSVVEMLRMSPLGVNASETLVGPDWSPSSVSGVPSIFRRGVSAVAVSRDRYEGSGFTRLLYDGAAFVAYSTGSDFALSLYSVLSRPEPPPLVFAYWDDLDVGQHIRGPLPELVDLEIDRVNAWVRFVAERLEPGRARRTKLIITGDHGQVPMAPDRQLVADQDAELLGQLLRPPSGDRRATFFTARPGHLPALRALLEARRGPGSHLLEMTEALERGLFGPPPYHPEIRERLGDLLLLTPSPGGVSYTAPGSHSRGRPMLGAHGGLEPEELVVPMISGTIDEVAYLPPRPVHLPAGDSGNP